MVGPEEGMGERLFASGLIPALNVGVSDVNHINRRCDGMSCDCPR